MKKGLTSILFISLVLSLFSSCTFLKKPYGDGYNTNVIRFNVNPTYTHILSILIKEKDFLSQYLPDGVTIEWSAMSGAPNIRDALVSDSMDISVLASMATVTGIENGMPIYVLSGHVAESVGIFSKNDSINEIEDLLNANGIYTSSLSNPVYLATMAMCLDIFNDPLKLSEKFIPQDNDISIIAFGNTNDVDCFAAGFPNSVAIMQIPGVHQVVDLTSYAQGYDMGNYFVVNEKFYNNNPTLIEAIRKAQIDALNFLQKNPDDAAEILSTVFKIGNNISTDDMVDLIKEEIEKSPVHLNISGYDNVADLLYKSGTLTSPPTSFTNLRNNKSVYYGVQIKKDDS
jgi:NitT/TauT family transport system substrate-binding protein